MNAAPIALLALACIPYALIAQTDSDADGLSDAREQRLLVQFQPKLEIGRQDCSTLPAEFRAENPVPTVEVEDGTLYGQVFPARRSTPAHPLVEIHYYHLWRRDCGGHGHPLDTEHVAVLVAASGPDLDAAHWNSEYWYAGAHEQTVCDVSQIARASTLHAEQHGPKVWVSPGKHASYLDERLCHRGCGADRCVDMAALPAGKVINLGETGHPMNGIRFESSPEWPLEYKMSHSNFPEAAVARLEQLPQTDIAWFSPGRHPAQQIISVSASTEGALAGSEDNTASALSVAGDSTGDALQKSYYHTKGALGSSISHVGRALHLSKQEDKPRD